MSVRVTKITKNGFTKMAEQSPPFVAAKYWLWSMIPHPGLIESYYADEVDEHGFEDPGSDTSLGWDII